MAITEFVPDYSYEMKLEEASQFISLPPDQLVSIKIRPTDEVGSIEDRYVYPGEYDELSVELSRFPKVGGGYVSRGEAELYALPTGDTFLFVHHETGPEIIFALSVVKEAAVATGAVAVAAMQVITLINMICRIINKSADANNKGKPSGRAMGAGAISIEKRLVYGAKIVKQIKVVSDDTQDVITRIEELME